MNATTRFIEDAVKADYNGTSLVKKGNWTGINTWNHDLKFLDDERHLMAMLLDKDAWIAVGKVRWIEVCSNPDHGFIGAVGGEIGRLGCPCCGHDEDYIIASSRHSWKKKWHQFIAHLADGKTIDQSLSALEE